MSNNNPFPLPLSLSSLAMALFVFIDCAANVLIGGSFNETLSAHAHVMRTKKQPYWGWTADFIDTLFFWQPNHCKVQNERENKAGGVWNLFSFTRAN